MTISSAYTISGAHNEDIRPILRKETSEESSCEKAKTNNEVRFVEEIRITVFEPDSVRELTGQINFADKIDKSGGRAPDDLLSVIRQCNITPISHEERLSSMMTSILSSKNTDEVKESTQSPTTEANLQVFFHLSTQFISYHIFRQCGLLISSKSSIAYQQCENYARFIVGQLEKILDCLTTIPIPIQNQKKIKKALKNALLDNNAKVESIDKTTFNYLINTKSNDLVGILSAPEYGNLFKAYQDGSWGDEEEKEITIPHLSTSVIASCIRDFGIIDGLFEQDFVKAQLEPLLKSSHTSEEPK